MTKDQMIGVIQVGLAFIGGFVPSTFMSGDQVSQVVGAIVVVIVAIWSARTTVVTPK